MKCPECVEIGETSKVYSHGGSVTCMGFTPYWDEQGVYHSHDPNRFTSNYTCSKGHSWREVNKLECPAEDCDYGKTGV